MDGRFQFNNYIKIHHPRQARLISYLRELYSDLALQEPPIPQWAPATAPGALSPARLEPELRFCMQSHGCTDFLSIDQLLTSVQVSAATPPSMQTAYV